MFPERGLLGRVRDLLVEVENHAAGAVQGVEGVGVVEEEGGVVCERHAGNGEAVLVVVTTEEGADWQGRQVDESCWKCPRAAMSRKAI